MCRRPQDRCCVDAAVPWTKGAGHDVSRTSVRSHYRQRALFTILWSPWQIRDHAPAFLLPLTLLPVPNTSGWMNDMPKCRAGAAGLIRYESSAESALGTLGMLSLVPAKITCCALDRAFPSLANMFVEQTPSLSRHHLTSSGLSAR